MGASLLSHRSTILILVQYTETIYLYSDSNTYY
nr:MAG TPA: hypothetical protein [Bacteriophage sp.]